ncbi:hypothetical protein J4437_07055 [Candidatus Woesearchaeota archaeon]|nr:hypothetical protein [Candidatus Woesearchaeota archaeon]
MVLKKKNNVISKKSLLHLERTIRIGLHHKKRKEVALLWLILGSLGAFASVFIFNSSARITGLAVLEQTKMALTGEIGLWLLLFLTITLNAYFFSKTWNKRRIVRIRKDYILKKKHYKKR